MRHIQPEILKRARELRQRQTPAEQILWQYLRNAQLDGIKFRRQHPIGRFIVDFYCAQTRLVIEIDGDSHADQVEYDQMRTNWLESQGYQVIRFTNCEVMEHPVDVMEDILEHRKKDGEHI